MSLDGIWDAVVNSPMGPQKTTLRLSTEGGKVTGEGETESGMPVSLLNLKIAGDKVSWSVEVTSPMKMTVDFEATLAGNALNGVARPGFFGKFPFTAAKRS